MEVAEQEYVADAACHTQPAFLRQPADDQPAGEGNQPVGMARARPFLGEAQHSRYGKQKDKKGGHKTGQDEAVRPLYFIGAAQGKSFFQAQHTDADAEREAGKAGNGGKVAPWPDEAPCGAGSRGKRELRP